jgi:hypothetical protein
MINNAKSRFAAPPHSERMKSESVWRILAQTADFDLESGSLMPLPAFRAENTMKNFQGFGKPAVCNLMKTVFKVCQENPNRNAALTHNP